MAEITQVRIGSQDYDIKDPNVGQSATINSYQYFTSTSNGTTATSNASMQVMLPWNPNSGSWYPLCGFGLTKNISSTALFEQWTYTGSSGAATGKIAYGIKVIKTGRYLLSYTLTGRTSTSPHRAVSLIKTNTSFAISGCLDDQKFTGIVPYMTTANTGQTISRTSFYSLSANDIIVMGTSAPPNSTSRLCDIFLYHNLQHINAVYLG